MRVLIVDDEPLARTALADILEARADIDGFDCANDAVDAEERLSRENYDVMLLDISMPERNGLELLDRLQRSQRALPAVVFVTAHAQHALAAFERHAIDYVLKPFSRERVNQALEFASRRTATERAARLVDAIPHLKNLVQPSAKIAIKSNGRILFIDPRAVIAVKAEGNYVLLEREAGSYLLRESITTVADKLKAYGFIRIHRSVLINSAFVQDVRPCETGEYELRVKGGKEYTVTRMYKSNLRFLAQFWIGTGNTLTDDPA